MYTSKGFSSFRRLIFGPSVPESFDSRLRQEPPELYTKHRLTFTIYFADGGYVIQTMPTEETQSRATADEPKIYIVTEFDKLSDKIKEIIVSSALKKLS